MAIRNILVKPIITEKSELLSDEIESIRILGRHKKANKIQIKKCQ